MADHPNFSCTKTSGPYKFAVCTAFFFCAVISVPFYLWHSCGQKEAQDLRAEKVKEMFQSITSFPVYPQGKKPHCTPKNNLWGRLDIHGSNNTIENTTLYPASSSQWSPQPDWIIYWTSEARKMGSLIKGRSSEDRHGPACGTTGGRTPKIDFPPGPGSWFYPMQNMGDRTLFSPAWLYLQPCVATHHLHCTLSCAPVQWYVLTLRNASPLYPPPNWTGICTELDQRIRAGRVCPAKFAQPWRNVFQDVAVLHYCNTIWKTESGQSGRNRFILILAADLPRKFNQDDNGKYLGEKRETGSRLEQIAAMIQESPKDSPTPQRSSATLFPKTQKLNALPLHSRFMLLSALLCILVG